MWSERSVNKLKIPQTLVRDNKDRSHTFLEHGFWNWNVNVMPIDEEVIHTKLTWSWVRMGLFVWFSWQYDECQHRPQQSLKGVQSASYLIQTFHSHSYSTTTETQFRFRHFSTPIWSFIMRNLITIIALTISWTHQHRRRHIQHSMVRWLGPQEVIHLQPHFAPLTRPEAYTRYRTISPPGVKETRIHPGNVYWSRKFHIQLESISHRRSDSC